MDYKPYNSELPNLRKPELIRMVEDLRERIDLLEEESWPFEWVIASEERARREAAENENKRLRETLAEIKMLPLNFAATTALPRIIPGMTDSTYEHGILKGFTAASDMARHALEGKDD